MLKKRNLIFLCLLILGILLLSSCFLKPPVTEGILKGQVIIPEGSIEAKDLTGQALANATVNIIDPVTGDIIATTTTDANGYYQVFVPAGGPYLLQAVKDGIKVQQITSQVEVGIEYDLGIADCTTTTVALIVQAMLVAEDFPNDPADINLAEIEADPDFNDVMNPVCNAVEADEDPAGSAVIQQAVEDFLYPPAPASSPTTITIAAIPGVTAPVTGATPVTAITATAQYTGAVTWSPNHGTFAGETVYTATITLTAKTGFTLTGVAENFFTVADVTTDTNPADSGVVTAVFPETAAVITIAAIPGVTAPVTGATPATAITATDQYTGAVTWSPNHGTFAGETVYTATITLTAKTGFTLTGVTGNFFTVDGVAATNDADSGVVTTVFPATAAVITIAAIPGVTAPVTGATPATAITATDQYTGAVTWSPNHGTFAGETVYTATITLTAKTGFTLTGVAEDFFTVAGVTTDTNPADSGVVTAVFPETAAVITIAAIPGVTAPVTGATPATTITPTDQYTGAVTWSPNHGTFAGETVYTATITLTAEAGFTLTGVAEDFFTVAGVTTDTNPADSGVVTAVFPETAAVAIGASCGGGIVAYILQSGDPGYVEGEQHGLIAATADQSGGKQWYNGTYVVTGATGIAIGTGQANTTAIVTIQGAGSYAAQLCNDLTAGSYSDWYLPSRGELNKLYINRLAIGGFTGYPYWSSSERNAGLAWYQFFSNGYQYYSLKDNTLRVRAVRAF